uniref:SH2 domain-containing protein n=1 Tax=Parascaris equorum TaxID=6256 RepID=A0A914RXK9_PAREQ
LKFINQPIFLERTDVLPQKCELLVVAPVPLNKPIVEPPILSDTLMWRYIGVLTRAEAEDAVKPPTEFRFYHQWEPTEKSNEVNRLPLTVFYRSSRNNPFHWLVRTMGEIIEDNVSKKREFLIRGYYIEHGGPMFPNLSTLVQFYENHSYNRNGYIDVFSVANC